MPNLGTAYVQIKPDYSKLRPGLNKAEGVVKTSVGSMNKVLATIGFASLAAAGAAALGTLSVVLKQGIADASDFEETISKVATLFGPEETAKLARWGSTAADTMGLSSQAALDAVGSIGNMFLQLDASAAKSSELSTEMVQLSTDIASFQNVAGGANEVLMAMQSAFRGEYDALQRYIPIINAATVQQEALADSGKKTAKELTALDKALAVHKIILRGVGAAAGDFGRTSDGLANQQRTLDANIKDLSVVIGMELLPVVADSVKKFNDWYKVNKDLINSDISDVMERVASTFVIITDNAGSIISVMKWVAIALGESSGLTNIKRLTDLINTVKDFRDSQDQAGDIFKIPETKIEPNVAIAPIEIPIVIDVAEIDAELEKAFESVDAWYTDMAELQATVAEEAKGRPMGVGIDQLSEALQEQNEIYFSHYEYIKSLQDDLAANEYENSINRGSIAEWLTGFFISEEARKNDAIGRMQKKALGNFLSNSENAMAYWGKQNKSVFEAYKAYKTAEAVISTIDGTVKAWNAGMSVGGPWAPVVAAAYAASAIAWGYARVSEIQGTSYGGGGGGGSGGGGGVSASVGSYPTSGGSDQQGQPGQGDDDQRGSVNIYLDGIVTNDEFAISLAEKLSQLVDTHDVRLVASNSKTADSLG